MASRLVVRRPKWLMAYPRVAAGAGPSFPTTIGLLGSVESDRGEHAWEYEARSSAKHPGITDLQYMKVIYVKR
jgi:hypothetical protein